MENINLIPLLDYIDPSFCTYQEWVNVGMALKLEGYSVADWDTWSLRDAGRYHPGECVRKWNTFDNNATSLVTGATIVDMAKRGGWTASAGPDIAYDWDDLIPERDDQVVVDKNWVEGRELEAPGDNWDPVKDLIKYLSTLFDSTDYVGYVTSSWEKDGKFLPNKGNYGRTAGELIEELTVCDGDLGAVLGDYNPKAGAWIRFNPLDGKGVRNENVTDFRYALVESDSMELEKQNEIIRQLELPVACLVYSGGKSVHAIVHIDAGNYEEYRKRVDYLYAICRKNGLAIDTQNRNPSRLSRMPGVLRDGKKQFLIDTNLGKETFQEWREWIEAVNDDLPEPESLKDVWNDLPPLSPSLIEGVLRK